MTKPPFTRPLLAASLLALAGCAFHPADLVDPARHGPFFAPANHAGEAHLPRDVRRVVLLPVAATGGIEAETTGALDPVFAAALQRENRFEVVALTRAECRQALGAAQFDSASALPHGFLARLREHYAADAVLFVDLTVARTQRPLALGVRAKLATTGDAVRLVWTFDNVFSAADPAVLNSARRHYRLGDESGLPVDRSEAVLQSPSRFATYAAQATFATLPAR